MPRILIALLVTLITSIALIGAAAPAVARPNAEVIAVQPPVATYTEFFGLAGLDFQPGGRLTYALIAPDGQRFVIRVNGVEQVIVVASDGGFLFSMLPIRDLLGAPLGVWNAQFCYEGTTACWTSSFEITGRLPGEFVMADPPIGLAPDTFTFYGVGFQPNSRLGFAFTDSTGTVFVPVSANGQPTVLQADPGGVFIVPVPIAQAFPTGLIGPWSAVFCYEGTQFCWVVPFEIVAPPPAR